MGALAGRALTQVGDTRFIAFLDDWSTATAVAWDMNDIANIADAETALSTPIPIPMMKCVHLPSFEVIDHIIWYEASRLPL